MVGLRWVELVWLVTWVFRVGGWFRLIPAQHPGVVLGLGGEGSAG